METKDAYSELKDVDDRGRGSLVFATLNAIDKDNDVLLNGAIRRDSVPMIPAHDWTSAPIGKAQIYEAGNEMRADFALNINTKLGRDWYESLRFDLKHGSPLQRFSYGYTVKDSSHGTFQGERVRFLRKVTVHEVSPCLVASGVNTRVLSLKSNDDLRSVERTLNKVKGFLLAENFHEMTSHGNREVHAVDDSFFDCVHIIAGLAARELGIEKPKAIRFFRECLPNEKADLPFRGGINGLCDGNEIFIKVGRGGDDLIKTVAHEVRHLGQGEKTHSNAGELEAEADSFGKYFAAKFGTIPSWAGLYAYTDNLVSEWNPKKTYAGAPGGSYLINGDGFVYKKNVDAWRALRRWQY